jgi:voltage-gated potassium channel
MRAQMEVEVGEDVRSLHPVQRFFLLDVLRDKDSRPVFYWAMAVLVIGILVYHWLEGWSYLDLMYFCVISLAMIGYGDRTPTTPGVKIFIIIHVINSIAILLAMICTMWCFHLGRLRIPFVESGLVPQ